MFFLLSILIVILFVIGGVAIDLALAVWLLALSAVCWLVSLVGVLGPMLRPARRSRWGRLWCRVVGCAIDERVDACACFRCGTREWEGPLYWSVWAWLGARWGCWRMGTPVVSARARYAVSFQNARRYRLPFGPCKGQTLDQVRAMPYGWIYLQALAERAERGELYGTASACVRAFVGGIRTGEDL